MKLNLKKEVFLPKAMVDLLHERMGASIHFRLDRAKSVNIPDEYVSGDSIQILATYLHNCGALSDKDAATIVDNSRFRSIEELADHWSPKVDSLIYA